MLETCGEANLTVRLAFFNVAAELRHVLHGARPRAGVPGLLASERDEN